MNENLKALERSLTTKIIYLELAKMPKDSKLTMLAREWMNKKNPDEIETGITIRMTNLYMNNSSRFEEDYAVLNTLRILDNEKFNRFICIAADVRYVCE